MAQSSMEMTLQAIVKKLLLVAIGSGLLTNALYIYGQAYYQGYIERLGFEYSLFPIDWTESLQWTYAASRELGASSLSFWVSLSTMNILVIVTVFYFFARAWMSISNMDKKENVENNKAQLWVAKKKEWMKDNTPTYLHFIFPVISWLLITEQSLWAFVASYFLLVFIFFMAIFFSIWAYFPMIGVSHGKYIAELRLERYKTELCGNADDYWSECFSVSTSHIVGSKLSKTADELAKLSEEIEGRLMLKNGNLIGMLTTSGPVTLSMPNVHFHKTVINPCYKDGCVKKKDETANL